MYQICLCSHYSNLVKRMVIIVCQIVNIQGFVIIRDENHTLSRIIDLAPKFLWDVTVHMLENEESGTDQVLFCRKKFWAIV